MALINFPKLNIFAILVILLQESADTATYVSDNAIGTNEASQSDIYAAHPQEYYTQQTYQKYTPQPENQIQTAPEPTETGYYKIPVNLAKYVVSQVAKPPQTTHGNQDSSPYLYTVTRVVPASVTYATHGVGSKHEEIPKKYHYGYRVSNPYTGSEFGHSEVNDGQITKGYYHVLLPDGRLQNVKYWAGPSGYHATITYETKY